MRKNGKIQGKAAIAAHQNIKERDYWLEQLSGQWHKTRFVYDYRDTGAKHRKLETIDFDLSSQLVSQLIKMSRGADHTLHMILSTGIVLLLHKYTGSSDILTGTPVYKQDIELSLLINPVLVLRNQVKKGMTFKQLLLQMRETIIKATEHYRYPMEILAEQLNKPLSKEDFPLFETGVLLENIHDKSYIQHIPLTVLFSFNRSEKGVTGAVEYDSTRFRKSTIRGIISHFVHFMDQALANPDSFITDLSPMTPEERRQVLETFNNTAADYPINKTIYQLFEEQVERTPNHTALAGISPGSYLSYKKLNEKSNQLAHFLRGRGVKADSIVAIMLEPCLEMIIGILAILKAGGAYLPIDPGAPQKRVNSLLHDSQAEFLLTTGKCRQGLSFVSLRGFEKSSLQPYLTPCRSQVENLDSLQFPNRSLIDYEQYKPYIGQAMVKNSITIHMSRGCVYNCAYCFKIWPKKYVLRSAENVFQEINLYYQMGIRRFAFVDDLPNINVKESSKLFKLIIQNGLKVHLHFPNGIRGDILTPGYIDLMVEAGAITMDLALETTSPRLQKLVRKNLNLKKLEENIRYITENHPQVILELQILHGIPTETEADARDSLEFIKRIKWVHFPYIHVLNIYPNSDMAGIAVAHGVSRQAIERSADLAYHELPETLPFPESFTRKYQAEFLNEYFMAKERLLQVLPYQMKVLTEDELVQKYNSYLPVEINSFAELLDYAGISRYEIKGEFLPPDYGAVPGLNQKLKAYFPQINPKKDALRILLLDLSQYFTHHSKIMYDVVEPPLGLLYLLTHLQRTYGDQINGKIAKSRMDFDSFEQLWSLINDFNPHVIGIRTLNFYKDFFHETIALIKQWRPGVPIVAGGPYATSNTNIMLKDRAIDLAVVGEGEITFAQLVGKILENNKKLPDQTVLKEIPGLAFAVESREHLAPENRDILIMERLSPLLSGLPKHNLPLANSPLNLAYIIYTSGSTGIPKGVLIQHNHVVNQLVGLRKRFELDSGLHYILLAAYTFDVSVMHIFSPLITGAKVHLIDEETRKDSLKLWRFVNQRKIDIINIVPAYMKILLQNIENKQIHLKYLFVGGDVFDVELYKALKETFAVKHIINIYGPTETTINATLYLCEHVEAGASIPIGKPLINYRAYILDLDLNPVPIGAAGELYIGGESVARGYLNRPELTFEKFLATEATEGTEVIFNQKLLRGVQGGGFLEKSPPGRRRLYKTGDQARWLPGGNIEFLGRIDRQVKVRGFRIELGEIEAQLSSYKGIKEAIVIPREDRNGDRYLCAYIVTGSVDSCGELGSSEIKAYLQGQLPYYMVPTYIVILEKIPLTPGGKPDKKALPEPGIGKIDAAYAAPRSELEEELVKVWAEVMAVDKNRVGIDTNFFDLGGHSLKATILISRIHKQLNVKIPLVELFKTPTIRGLSKYIGVLEEETYAAIEPVEKKEYYLLSSAQKRLFVLDQVTPDSIVYNMPQVLISREPIDRQNLEQSFRKLIQRHESLRTSFHMINGKPVQKIRDEVEFEINFYDSGREGEREIGNILESSGRQGNRQTGILFKSSGKQGNRGIGNKEDLSNTDSLPSEHFPKTPLSLSPSLPEFIKNFIRPFDLSRAPLLRVGLIYLHTPALTGHPSQEGKEHQCILMVDLHHIVTDGMSQEILIEDFIAFYSGENPVSLVLQYRDYAQWQNSEKRQTAVKHQETWWLEQFQDEIPVLDLPTDYPRPIVQAYEGERLNFVIHEVETSGLKTLASQEGATLFMVLLALFNVFLAKICGKEDIIVGIPVAGRRHSDLKSLVGMFVNTLALRAQPHGNLMFRDFLRQVRENTLQAFENQEYPFEDLVEHLTLDRDTGRNPLFDVMFTLHNIQATSLRGKGLAQILKPYPHQVKISKFDMTFSGTESAGGVTFAAEYSTRLFKQETMLRYVNYFQRVISAILVKPGIILADIEIISEEERKQILMDFNHTATDYPRDKTIHELFREQVEQTPDQIALMGVHETHEKHKKDHTMPYMSYLSYMSYKKLHEKSHQLACQLQAKGVQPGAIVGIMMERSIDMIVALLAILEAGAAYLPINPDYPEDRKRYMLADSGSKIVLTRQEIANLSSFHLHLSPWVNAPVTSLAYITYTSGSTGKPKGVMMNHQGVVRLVKNTDYMEFKAGDKLLPTCELEFDVSTFEIWGSLLNGINLCLASKVEILAVDQLKKVIKKFHVDIMWLTSSLFNQVVQLDIEVFAGLKRLLVGGEALSPPHINQLRKKYPQLTVINGYGPTENTTFSTTFRIYREYKDNIPIGKPIANSTAYIVDKNNHLLPVGIPGELLVGGDGVSRGYLNNPELTAERFIHLSNRSYMSYKTYISKKIYKTGDLARWLPEGNIQFLGRMDHQVKIRGFRIEPGEIENQLFNHDLVKEAKVLLKENKNQDKYLAAYILLAEVGTLEKEAAITTLREYLFQKLPPHMIPSYFIFLEKMPLTPAGKIDSKFLPDPQETRPEMAVSYLEPQTDKEIMIANIWKEVLGIDKIGVNDNFFELGGNSLKLVQLYTRLKDIVQKEISPLDLFRYTTIVSLTKYFSQEGEEDRLNHGHRAEMINKGKDKLKNLRKKARL